MNTIYYKHFAENDQKVVWVSKLMSGNYRVSAFKKYEAHTYECTDINLRRWEDRRWLEKYIKHLGTTDVYFGNQCDNHYRLEKYKELHTYCDISFLDDLKIA